MWGAPGEPADSYYAVRPECTDVPRTRFKIKPGKTHGKLHSLRMDIWISEKLYVESNVGGSIHQLGEFLLGCYDPESTFDERDQIRQHRRVQYARWKNKCGEIFPALTDPVGSLRRIEYCREPWIQTNYYQNGQ
ncbi:uncharacterized protein LOC120172553 [Hibiscus syriacus]|uniref:uncharacterized protein LOC120172553 n=1 Tax=Hibiscus syriacus TaxID=106335 RepID=UPI001920B1A1|nr:uncharacterized protein LOC120172553 [Hibiscus syriacus]